MPTRALHMRKVRELIRLKYEARLSHEQIAGALAISKGVVAKYVARIERTGLEPGALMSMSDAEVMARIAPAPRPASYGGRIKPDFAHLHAELKRPNVTLTLLWQEYCAANAGGLTYRFSQFADLYRQYVATLRRSMRQVHRAGEKLFVDYAGQSIGYGREGDRAQIFVATLGRLELHLCLRHRPSAARRLDRCAGSSPGIHRRGAGADRAGQCQGPDRRSRSLRAACLGDDRGSVPPLRHRRAAGPPVPTAGQVEGRSRRADRAALDLSEAAGRQLRDPRRRRCGRR